MAKPYTEDSLTGALDHHVTTGAVRSYQRAPESTNRWLVEVRGLSRVTLTTDQLYGLALGLAAGERRWKADVSHVDDV